jgi:hypothetical protein
MGKGTLLPGTVVTFSHADGGRGPLEGRGTPGGLSGPWGLPGFGTASWGVWGPLVGPWTSWPSVGLLWASPFGSGAHGVRSAPVTS